jgi:hypothetical protein
VIDFRYHVVSIVAVLLALAVGIVLGTNTLSGDVLKNLKTETSQLRKEKQELRDELAAQKIQLTSDESFAELAEPMLVADVLSGERVLVVSLPGVSGTMRDRFLRTLELSGASVTGQLEIQASMVDRQQETLLGTVVGLLAPPGLRVPADATAVHRAAAALAETLVAPPPPNRPEVAPVVDAEATALLEGLTSDGFIKVTAQPETFASLVVVLAPPAPAKDSPQDDAANAAFITIVQSLDAGCGGAVLLGPTGSDGTGGVVGALRSNGSASKQVSGVDDGDLAAGRIAAVLALAGQLAGQSGQYGIGQGASGPLPTPSAVR